MEEEGEEEGEAGGVGDHDNELEPVTVLEAVADIVFDGVTVDVDEGVGD